MATIPSTGVNLATHVRDVLNAAGGSVSNDIASFFKEAAKINPWSKHKPVVLAQDFCQDYDSGAANYNSTWWRGSDGNCGLTPKSVTSIQAVVDAMDGGMNGWTYRLPKGGSSEPLRLGDFRGYMTDAKPMLWNFLTPGTASSQLANSVIVGSCMLQMSNSSSLTFADFPAFKNYYLGMYIKQNNGTQARYKTSALTLGNNGSSVEISAYGLPEGKWTAYPFISTTEQDSMQGAKAGTFYTLPMNNASEFEVVSSYVIIMITAEKKKSTGSLVQMALEITVKVKSASPTTFTNCNLLVRYPEKAFTDPMMAGEVRASAFPSEVTVTADNAYHEVWSGDVNIYDSEVWKNPRVWVSLQSGNYLQSTMVLDDTSSIIQ